MSITVENYVWDLENKETYNNRYGRYKYNRQFAFIERNFRTCNNILDVAGGSGRFALPLYEICQDILVADINQEALRLLSQRNDKIKKIQGDFITIPFSETFSHILCIEALSYFHQDTFFRKVNTLLDSEGRFIFMMVNPRSWRFQLRKIKKEKTEYNEISLQDMMRIIEENGMTLTDIQGFNWMPLPLSWSNSILVDIFSFVERILNLGRWYAQSPWLMVSVKRK